MEETLGKLKRTHYCGAFQEEMDGKEVVVNGWCQRMRNLGALIFADLRDRTGLVQVVFEGEGDRELFEKASAIRSEFVLAVRGRVRLRSNPNPEIPTGRVEIVASELRILSASETPPIYVEDDANTSEAMRLKYRYLDLRRPKMQHNLLMRHRIIQSIRHYMDEMGFLEIDTPMLSKSTPEGARDYLVPSRQRPGSFYALPQSPQLMKQLLMVSGFDRYFQIAKCFRDEDLRADRQPEFSQVDIEMSFVDEEDIMAINEGLMGRVFREVLGMEIPEHFPRITYREAMERYGSDKPDTRFGLELIDVTNTVKGTAFKVFADAIAGGGCVKGINAKGGAGFSRKEIDALANEVKTYGAKGLAWLSLPEGGMKSSFAKFMEEGEIEALKQAMGAETGDLLVFVADPASTVVTTALGLLRLHLGDKLGLIDHDRFDILWVTEFPMFEYDEEEGRYVAVHHPFTHPMEEDIPLLTTDPGAARAKAYDLVINGTEVGGGSVRIHRKDLQLQMFELLGFTEEKAQESFGFLLNAFKYGVPPHGGIAYGLDRMVMLLAKVDNIREVIAFPKVQNASCPLTEAPTPVDVKQLEDLGIRVVEDKA